MLYFDVTKSGKSAHRSGLTRVSSRLLAELGSAAYPVSWHDSAWRDARSRPVALAASDWLLTPELFSAEERPGFSAFLAAKPCRLAAIFHDAIPLKHPHITWPQSVARHPAYLKMLAGFDRILAVSEASRRELAGFWRWQGLESPPPIDLLPLGADATAQPRIASSNPEPKTQNPEPPVLLCLGILEPRKNQSFLLDVCADLWRGGLDFALHLVGRVNPHFGPPIVSKIKALQREHPAYLHFHDAAPDTTVARLYATARATVFPTIAEGCGLPLLESLWMGVPCVHSDLPVLRENADAGGCLPVALNDRAAWSAALRRVISDATLHARLVTEARTRPLPTWAAAAQSITASLR